MAPVQSSNLNMSVVKMGTQSEWTGEKVCKQEVRHVIEAIYSRRFDFCGQLTAPQRDF